jgi:hypothetical protein
MDDNQAAVTEKDSALTRGAEGVTKIVVAVHGIGKQLRSSTIRSVAQRFGDRCEPPLPVFPLGHFSIVKGNKVRWTVLQTGHDPATKIGFAEVYWADIPSALVKMDDTLEETKAWARTIVSRAESLYRENVTKNPELESLDFKQGMTAIDTIIEGIAVIEKLCALANRAGLFKFEVGTLLHDYVDDVQTVTEFPQYRMKAIHQFYTVLNDIVASYQQEHPGAVPEIYLVAHSEGTVISLLALLHALSSRPVRNPDLETTGDDLDKDPLPQDGTWVQYVKGFMTIGSPLDKHVVLWPGLWQSFGFDCTARPDGSMEMRSISTLDDPSKSVTLSQKIQWRNYFDFGDPIGFRLDQTMSELKKMHCEAFEFDKFKHDFGFSRSWMPGKAHIDYWNDAAVFNHFIDNVVQPQPGVEAAPPTNKRANSIIAISIPYLIAFAMHVAAILALYQGLSPSPASMTAVWQVPVSILLLGILLYSVTVAARLPTLVKPERRWGVLSIVILLIGMGFGALLAYFPEGMASGIGNSSILNFNATTLSGTGTGIVVLLGAAVITVAVNWWFLPRDATWGRRLLLLSGSILCLAISLNEYLSVQALAWKTVGVCLAFVYLWWLGMILFDLAFVWHRYIRNAVCIRMIRAWKDGKDTKPDPKWGLASDPLQNDINEAHKNRAGA